LQISFPLRCDGDYSDPGDLSHTTWHDKLLSGVSTYMIGIVYAPNGGLSSGYINQISGPKFDDYTADNSM
jgi:hypothetical protein